MLPQPIPRVAIDGAITAHGGHVAAILAALEEPFPCGAWRAAGGIRVFCPDVVADEAADEALYGAIAPHVERGAITDTDTDGHRWHYVFSDGTVTRHDEE